MFEWLSAAAARASRNGRPRSVPDSPLAKTKTATLRGSVPTAEQKAEAEKIARNEAPGYRIVNQLAVVAK